MGHSWNRCVGSRHVDLTTSVLIELHVLQSPKLPPGEDFVRQNTAIKKMTSLEKRCWLVSWNSNLHFLPCKVKKPLATGLCCREMLWIVPLSACRGVHLSIISLLWQGLYWKNYLLTFKQRSALTSVQQDGCWCSKTNYMCKNDLATRCKMASFQREHCIWWMWMQRSFIAATSPWATKGNCCCYFMSFKGTSMECTSLRFKFKGVRRADARPQRLITNNYQSNPDKSFITFGVQIFRMVSEQVKTCKPICIHGIFILFMKYNSSHPHLQSF